MLFTSLYFFAESFLNSSSNESECHQLQNGGQPALGALTIGLMFWQNIFAGLFVHFNGGGWHRPGACIINILRS
jgi:hypothetical protein